MKPARPQDPIRWRDRGADTHALESRAALLADAASQVPALPPQAVSRIEQRVLARRTRRGLLAFSGRAARTRLAFAIAVLVVCVTTAGGARLLWRKYAGAGRKQALPPAAETTVPQLPQRRVRVAAPTPDTDPAPPAAAPPAPSRADTPPPARTRPAAPALGPSAPETAGPSSSAPSEAAPVAPRPTTESTLVAEALFDLRQLGDPRAALSTLDRYARAFPHGVLETEALRTRIEAVIQLHDLKTALALLDGDAARAGGLGDDLLLTRAELRAAVGRLHEAASDFTDVLGSAAGSLAADAEERALYGRAVCLRRLAQNESARADLLAYQKRFPEGRFAREVERALADEQPPSRP